MDQPQPEIKPSLLELMKEKAKKLLEPKKQSETAAEHFARTNPIAHKMIMEQHLRGIEQFSRRYRMLGRIVPAVLREVTNPETGLKEMIRQSFHGSYRNNPETGVREQVTVPIYARVPKATRYSGADLREIRRRQTLKAIEGQTHFTDGTPIKADHLGLVANV